MAIKLCDIDEKNFDAVIGLSVGEGQETFVAPNVKSIAQSKIFPYLVPQAVYAYDELIGFALYGRDPDEKSYWIVRLMVDAAHQGKGHGKAAALALIDKLRGLPECSEVFLSYVPGNDRAGQMYLSIGFQNTGRTNETGEIILRYDMAAISDAEQISANNVS